MTKQIVELANNFFLVIINENSQDFAGLNINTLTWSKLKDSNEKLILKIDFAKINHKHYKSLLRKLFRIKKRATRSNIFFGIEGNTTTLLGYIINHDPNNQKQIDFIHGINAIFHNNLYDMYNYIYDITCDYLDFQFASNNWCNFQNNICAAGRKMGCCRKLRLCKHLKNNSCSTRCISCKLFTCPYLWKQGVQLKLEDILLLNTFFSKRQKNVLTLSVFNTKEILMRRLLLFAWNRKI